MPPSFFSLAPSASSRSSAAVYVPLVLFSRALSFLRILIVAKILGDAGQRQFGLYQPSLEFINCLVPLVMFGLGDVAERYAARYEKQNLLAPFLKRQFLRVTLTGTLLLALLLALSPWLAYAIFRLPAPNHPPSEGILLIAACAATILVLALYQYLAALLRGLRAYPASAAMEAISAILFLLLSALAAFQGTAIALVFMYALSVLLPALFYGILLLNFLKKHPASAPQNPPALAPVRLHSFAAWALLRLLLIMTFGFLSIWGIRYLAPYDAQTQTAAYAPPYRIAQLLASVATTLWASTYAIAARSWSHHQTRRAKVQLFRVGKFGALLLTLLAILLLLTRNLLAALLPSAYCTPINLYLPPLLAVFIWYGLLAFASTYSDLQEKPRTGALLWLTAVLVQLTLILLPNALSKNPLQHILLASALGLAAALLLLAPILLWRPLRLTATALPIALLALAPLSLFSPPWIVDLLAPPLMLAPILLLHFTGQLLRPPDRRALKTRHAKKPQKHRHPSPFFF